MSTPSGDTARLGREWFPLLHEALARGDRFRWSLRGTSMHPTLPPGCRIEIASMPAEPRIGDIIVFARENELVAHRLVHRSGHNWITQGDGRLGPDPPLSPAQVLGAVVAAYGENGRRYWPGRFPRTISCLWVGRYHAFQVMRRLRDQLRRLRARIAV